MKIGIIYCSYGVPDLINELIKPWTNLKDKLNIKIAAVHGQFKEYHEIGTTDNDYPSQVILKNLEFNNDIDYLYLQDDYNLFVPDKYRNTIYQTEAEIRDKGLQFLLKEEVDYVMLWDGDEEITEDEIDNIINYIQKDEFIAWYSLEYKNLTFNRQTYTKGFAPPRIFKVNYNNLKLKQMVYDNDVIYQDINGNSVGYKQLPNKKIPIYIANPLHYSWCDYERSKSKIEYQNKHFGHYAGCSFKINEDKKEIEWNQDYFLKTSQNPPELFKLE